MNRLNSDDVGEELGTEIRSNSKYTQVAPEE